MLAPVTLVFWGAALDDGILGISDRRSATLSGLQRNFERLSGMSSGRATVGNMLSSSALLGLGVGLLSTVSGALAAYAMVFLEGRVTRALFWATLVTLYFPIEARMLPTFLVAADLGLVDTLPGLILPILPIALSTLVLRQHFLVIPSELLEAARLDGAGPLRFLKDFILPLSLVPLAAVFLITFVLGWNQYLWPLMISIDNAHFPIMRGLNLAGSGSGPSLILASISLLPPLVLTLGVLRLMSRATAVRL